MSRLDQEAGSRAEFGATNRSAMVDSSVESSIGLWTQREHVQDAVPKRGVSGLWE